MSSTLDAAQGPWKRARCSLSHFVEEVARRMAWVRARRDVRAVAVSPAIAVGDSSPVSRVQNACCALVSRGCRPCLLACRGISRLESRRRA